MPHKEDGELARRCLRGERGAWELLVASTAPYLAESVRRTLARCGLPAGPQEVDDLVQDVYADVLAAGGKCLRRYEGRSSLRAYLAVIGMRKALAKPRPGPSLPESEPDGAPGPGEAIEREEVQGRIRACMRKLPYRTRLALLLQVEGATLREIGRVLGMKEDAAAQVVSRGRATLRDLLQSEDSLSDLRDPRPQ